MEKAPQRGPFPRRKRDIFIRGLSKLVTSSIVDSFVAKIFGLP